MLKFKKKKKKRTKEIKTGVGGHLEEHESEKKREGARGKAHDGITDTQTHSERQDKEEKDEPHCTRKTTQTQNKCFFFHSIVN